MLRRWRNAAFTRALVWYDRFTYLWTTCRLPVRSVSDGRATIQRTRIGSGILYLAMMAPQVVSDHEAWYARMAWCTSHVLALSRLLRQEKMCTLRALLNNRKIWDGRHVWHGSSISTYLCCDRFEQDLEAAMDISCSGNQHIDKDDEELSDSTQAHDLRFSAAN